MLFAKVVARCGFEGDVDVNAGDAGHGSALWWRFWWRFVDELLGEHLGGVARRVCRPAPSAQCDALAHAETLLRE